MGKITKTSSSFSFGEVSPDLVSREDLGTYEKGAMVLENFVVSVIGGIKRRSGLEFLHKLSGNGRLIEFHIDEQNSYCIVLTNLKISIFKNGKFIFNIPAPWIESDIKDIQWVQNENELLLVHFKYPPRILKMKSENEWMLNEWDTLQIGVKNTLMPFANFIKTSGISFTVNRVGDNLSKNANIVASDNFFFKEYVGIHLKINNGFFRVTEFVDEKTMNLEIIKEPENCNPVFSFEEQVFSHLRGYPKSITFYQNRLIIGGSRDLPSRIWMSKIGNYFNFELGEGLDDDAIIFDIISDKPEIIQSIFAGKHLQVFTTDSEWVITSFPMTPASVQLKKQTGIGSISSRYIPPMFIEGSTMFIAKNGVEIREFLFGEVEQAYSSFDQTVLSKHLMRFPLDQAYDITNRTLYIPMKDGSMAVLTINKDYGLRAWSKFTTAGKFLSVAIVGDKTYVMVQRNDEVFLEWFNDKVNTDCCIKIIADDDLNNKDINVSHLKNKVVYVIEDNIIYPVQKLYDNLYHLKNTDAENLEIGLPYIHTYVPLPPIFSGNKSAKKVRLINVVFRLMNSKYLSVDTGYGIRFIHLDKYNKNDFFNQIGKNKTLDVEVKSFGWKHSFNEPVFKIQSAVPANFQIVSVQANYQMESF